jgi:hypothetical protein
MDWHAMVFLGAYHGINPGMGWLFAVALGMQHGSARGVWRALPPIALGHAVAVGVVLAAAALVGLVVPLDTLRMVIAVTLTMFGVYRLWRHRHPRFGGMQVGFRDLTVWSFLMASAHGAGFMVLPFVLPEAGTLSAAAHHHHHAAMSSAHPSMAAIGAVALPTDAIALAIHTLAYLAVTALIAWIVYRKLGLRLLRTAWLNVDWVWAVALVITGVVVLVK